MHPPCRLWQINYVGSNDHAEELPVDDNRGVNALDGFELKPPVAHFAGNHERGVVGRVLGKRPKDAHAFSGFDQSQGVIATAFGLVALSEEVLGPVELLL